MDRVLVAFSNEESQRRIGRLLESCGLLPVCGVFSGLSVFSHSKRFTSFHFVLSYRTRKVLA